MPLVPAKCPNCGGNINVDQTLAAAICEYCGQPFIVEQAINNFNTTYNITNTNIINSEHVAVYENRGSEDNTVKRIELFVEEKEYPSAIEYLEKLKDLNVGNSEIPRLTGLIISSMEEQINTGIQNWDPESVNKNSEILIEFDKNNALAKDSLQRLELFKNAAGTVRIIEEGISQINKVLSGCSQPVKITVSFQKLIDAYIKLKEYDESISTKYRAELDKSFRELNRICTLGEDMNSSGEYLSYKIDSNLDTAWKNRLSLIERMLNDFLGYIVSITYVAYFDFEPFSKTDINEFNNLYKAWKDTNRRMSSYNSFNNPITPPSVYGRYVYGKRNSYWDGNDELRMLGRCITSGEELQQYLVDYCRKKRLCPICFEKLALTGKCKKSSNCPNCKHKLFVFYPDGSFNNRADIEYNNIGYFQDKYHMK